MLRNASWTMSSSASERRSSDMGIGGSYAAPHRGGSEDVVGHAPRLAAEVAHRATEQVDRARGLAPAPVAAALGPKEHEPDGGGGADRHGGHRADPVARIPHRAQLPHL